MTSVSADTVPRGRHAASKGLDLRAELRRGLAEGTYRWHLGGTLLLALLAWVPALAVRPGVITPDTKTYLYLDPTKFLSQVAFMWNPSVALGTVSHEYLGYLLPMGPFYVLFHLFGVPVWVAQRLWLGSILFAAGYGVLYLCRVLAIRGPGPVVAALAYMLSPYFLQYVGRISVILLPWCGLPFMLGLTIVALRRGGWRAPALFALVVALVSGINASSIIYVGVAPVLWLLYAVVVLREATWRQALGTALRIGVLTLGACVWWIAGLAVEAAYGVNVLKYTETVPSTSATSNASEVIRGLGYWYFYGSDHLGPWQYAAVRFTQNIGLLVTSYAVPILAVVSAALMRWKERAFFLLLVFVGMVLSVGAFPFEHPTAFGGVLKAFMTDTTAGLALRSTDRATPVVLLGLAMLLGCGVSMLWRRLSLVGLAVALLVSGLIVANNPSLFNGDIIANNFTQPASLPSYEVAAINHLNATHPGTRVLGLPGNDFASYRWGDTVDTPQPALLTRDFVTREQQIMGSEATADTLYALDGPFQDDVENTNSIAPMARLMSVGDVMMEYDQRYEHFGIPQPQLLALQMLEQPIGLSDPKSFGTPAPSTSTDSTLNEMDLASPSDLGWPPPIVTYTVNNPRPELRGESDQGSLLVDGDATGVDDLAGLGLLNTDSAIYYSGTLATQSGAESALAAKGAQLVVTDTNRKEAFRWDTLTANAGFTETPSDNPSKTDLSDSPIDLFPGAPLGTKTLAKYVGAVNVTSSSYGNGVSYTPEDEPYSALDDNFDTSWITGTFVPDPAGQWWQAQFTNPVTTDHLDLVQPQTGDRSRWVSRVTLTFDGSHKISYDLKKVSHTESGQVLRFPQVTFHTLRITIDGTTDNTAPPLTASAVGFSEVEIPGVTVQRVVEMPTDLLSNLGAASQADRLTLLMSRDRTSPFPPRSDPETTITRQFTLPSARTFTLSGSASLSALIPDDEIDALVGRSGGTGVVSAYSSGRLPGDLRATASATLDNDPTTAWQPGLGLNALVGATLTYNLSSSTTLGSLTMQVMADGRHSVPTSMTIAAGGVTRKVALPSIADSSVPGAVTTVPVTFPALSGKQFVVTFTGVREEKASNFYSAGPLALPLGIAEIGFPGVQSAPTPSTLPGTCVSNLITIDGQPISVAIVGSTQSALDNGEIQVVPCGPDANGISLAAGTHVVKTSLAHIPGCSVAASTCTGWNIDTLVLDSAAGGGAGPAAAATTEGEPELPATQPGAAPSVKVTATHIDGWQADVKGATSPFELVFGESVDAGWHAVATPGPNAPAGSHAVTLGSSQLVDSFANGWQVTSADLKALGGPDFSVTLSWTPQKEVWAGLFVSGLTLVVCLLIVFLPEPVRRRVRRAVLTRLPKRLLVDGPPLAGDSTEADAPVLHLPFQKTGEEVPHTTARIAVIAVVTGLVAAGVTSLLGGLVVAILVALGLRVARTRGAATVGAVAFVVIGCLSVVFGQAAHHYLPGSNWAASFVHSGDLIWIGLALFLADAVVSAASGFSGDAQTPPPEPPAPDGPSPAT